MIFPTYRSEPANLQIRAGIFPIDRAGPAKEKLVLKRPGRTVKKQVEKYFSAILADKSTACYYYYYYYC